uniref:EfeO-type cupredoxin-like domain-containing protein n=1 Tax=Eiseniibacteriota bacterium TaxID=2212470 RepID=A0A832MKN6_UNCEI
MSRWRALALGVAVAALAVSAAARLPRRAPEAAPPPPPPPLAEVAFEIGPSGATPFAAAVPKGHRVRLTVVNRAGRAIEARLAGYEDRVTTGALAPDSSWTGTFLADLPGEGFALLVDGEPAARLAVTGSHLEEGHR